MTAASWLLAGIAAAGLLLAGNHYPSGWALFAGAQVLSLPAALTGQPYALAPLTAAAGPAPLARPLTASWRGPHPLVGGA